MRPLTVVIAVALLSLLPSVVGAQEADPVLAQAKAHFETGKGHYQARDYSAAIREFKAAYQLRPSPLLDYNIGLAYDQQGKGRSAARHYRRYLEARPDADNRAEVEQRIAVLEQTAPPRAATDDDGVAAAPPPRDRGGADPYGGQYQASGPVRSTPPPARKSSLWWIVFPIAGGVTLIAITVGVALWVSALSSVRYGLAQPSSLDLVAPAIGAALTPPSHDHALFRF